VFWVFETEALGKMGDLPVLQREVRDPPLVEAGRLGARCAPVDEKEV